MTDEGKDIGMKIRTICRQDYHMQHPKEATTTILFPTFPEPEEPPPDDDADRGYQWTVDKELEVDNENP